jgi:hypothetical protein
LQVAGRGYVSQCYPTGRFGANYIPMGDPACRDCQGHKSTVAAHRDYIERAG